MNNISSQIAAAYARDGFVFPLDILSADEALTLRTDLEEAEALYADDPKKRAMVRGYPARLLPSYDALIRHPKMIAAASAVLGPDLLVWGSGHFIKEANTTSYVSWHQDLTYWGLDEPDEATLWVALSPASVEAGCMRFIPGSHRERIMPHADSFADENLLTRGQEIAIEVDDDKAVFCPLQSDELSLHYVRTVHASEPNQSSERRIGVAVRYITPDVSQVNGDVDSAWLVRGGDTHGNFVLETPPVADMDDAARAEHARIMQLRQSVLYKGVAGQPAHTAV